MKIKVLIGLFTLLSAIAGLAEANLLVNPAFRSADGRCPDGWMLAQDGDDAVGGFVATGGVMRISESPAATCLEVCQTIDIDDQKSYWFEVDVQADELIGLANVRYSYFDEKGDEWPGPKQLFYPYYAGPQVGWKRAAVPIPAGDAGRKLVKMKIKLQVFPPRDDVRNADNAIYFRNPSVAVYSGQRNVPMNLCGPRRPTHLSADPFQNTGPRPYAVERGGVGYIDLSNTQIPYGREVLLRIKAPKGVDYAFYGSVPKTLQRLDPASDGFLHCDARQEWASETRLLFTADETVPEKFSFHVDVVAGDESTSVELPVRQIAGPTPGKLPKARRFSSYMCAPLDRFSEDAQDDPLVRKLRDYIHGLGWIATRTCDFTKFLHYRQTLWTPVAREGEGVDGTPTGTFCDEDWVSRGSDYLVGVLERNGIGEKIREAEYAMWDYEPCVLGPVTAGCFCRDCRAAFAGKIGLTEVPSSREILKRHRAAWVDFRCRQRAETARTVATAVKKINPQATFCLCSDAHAPKADDLEYRTFYGIDLPLFSAFTDVFRSMNYGKDNRVFMSLEREIRLGNRNQTFFENGWLAKPRDGKLVGLQVLAGFFAGVELPFIGSGIDLAEGTQLSALRETMRFVAETEGLWESGRLMYDEEKSRAVCLEGPGESNFYTLERETADGKRYVLALNTSAGEDVCVTITPPSTRAWQEDARTLTLAPYQYELVAFTPRKACARVLSPDGRNELRLYRNPLACEVLRDGKTVVAKSVISLRVDGRELERKNANPPKVTQAKVTGVQPSPFYKKSWIALSGNETLVDWGDWAVRLSARDDGVAYRFETKMEGKVRVDDERADVCIPDASARTWVNFTDRYACEESVAVPTSVGETFTDGEAHKMIYLPFVYRTGGTTVAVTESDVCDYPIWNLKRLSGGASTDPFVSDFSRWPLFSFRCMDGEEWTDLVACAQGGRWIRVSERTDCLVRTDGNRTYPWRVFILADSPAKLCEADIVFALARPPAADSDFSWVRPGKVAWDWWNGFDNQGRLKGCTTKTYERFIDFAAKNGVEYVILDEGWSEKLDIWRFNPKVDVPYLIDYAAKRNVGIILWMAWAQIVGDEARVAEHFGKLGAKGFKVDFMDRGDAEAERFLWTFADECAKRHLLVDYHGAHRPTGMERAYPNVLNFEGVHGLECMKWFKNEYDFMASDLASYYTRMTAGPADYTPGAMDNYPPGKYKGSSVNAGSVGTRSRQMAMMTAFFAPLQMLCDSPTKYEKNMECFRFMAETPVVWDETRGLGGDPDSFVLVARRKGEVWYVAGLSNADARIVSVDLSFLGSGEWMAETFRDAGESAERPTSYVHETVSVLGGGRRDLRMAPGGGFVMRLTKR